MSGARTRRPFRRAAKVFLAGFVLSSTWNAIDYGGIQPSDMLLIVAFALAAAGSVSIVPRLPPLLLAGAALIALAGLLSEWRPTSAAYLAERFLVASPVQEFGSRAGAGTNMAQMLKFEAGLVGVPLAVAMLRPTLREVRWLADAFLASVVVSSAVAVLDAVHLSSVNRALLGFEDITGRQSGLTLQPNHLAVSAVLATPVALTLLVRRGGLPLAIRFAPLALLPTAILLTGSRGGAIGFAIACVLTVGTVRSLRRALSDLVGPILVAAALGGALSSGVIARLFAQSRLGGQGTVASNIERGLLRAQAVSDLTQSPIHGIGYRVITEAHEVHLQMLAAGGILAFAGYCLYNVALLRLRGRIVRTDPLVGPALVAAIVVWILLSFIENQVTNRYLYVPVALALAIAMHAEQRDMAADASRGAV